MKKKRPAAARSPDIGQEGGPIERFAEELGGLLESDPHGQAILRASVKLQEAARRVAEASDTANGRGWVRLNEILESAAVDPLVSASLGASGFLAVVRLLAGDAITDESGDESFRELHRAMSTSGEHREKVFDDVAIRKRVAQLIAANTPKMQAYMTAARQFGCSARNVRRIVTGK